MNKADQLKQVRLKLEHDAPKLPLCAQASDTVPGEGNPDAEIMFVGEAAGYHESVQRRPFVGLAGQLLNKTLAQIGLSRPYVYITNVVKCRPPQNRDPEPQEIATFAKYLDAEIDIIQPKIIATLGRFSMAKFLPDVKISAVHGQPRWVTWKERQILVLPLYHPAAALRAGNILRTFQADFAKLPTLLKAINEPPSPQPAIQSAPAEHQLSLI